VEQRIRIEIMGKDDFVGACFPRRVGVSFPDRKLASDGAGRFFAPGNWLGDLEGVGRETFVRSYELRKTRGDENG
jgi:hypothetical protein